MDILDELLNEDASVMSYTDDELIINSDDRTIYIPNTLAGVTSDEKSTRLKLRCSRYVGDDIDLSTMNVYINFKNANGEVYSYLTDDVAVDGTDITFSWLLSRDVTTYKGNVNFIVCAKKIQSDGKITIEWNTTLATLTVLEGLEPADNYIPTEKVDVATELMNAVNTLTEELNNVKNSITTVPTKVSQLENDKNYLTAVPGEYVTENELNVHTSDTNVHVTTADKNNWNGKVDSNQGTSNAGKLLGTNSSGDVVTIQGYGFEYNEETKMLEYGTDPTTNLNQGIGLDDTLSKKGYAAEASAVGELKSDLVNIDNCVSSIVNDIGVFREKVFHYDANKIHSSKTDTIKLSVPSKTKVRVYANANDGTTITYPKLRLHDSNYNFVDEVSLRIGTYCNFITTKDATYFGVYFENGEKSGDFTFSIEVLGIQQTEIKTLENDLNHVIDLSEVFDKNTIKNGYVLSRDGTLHEDSECFVSDFINSDRISIRFCFSQIPSDNYIRVGAYDSDKIFIERYLENIGSDGNYIFVPTDDCKYIRVSVKNNAKDYMSIKTINGVIDNYARRKIAELFDVPNSIKNLRLYAHRGYTPEAPENSIPAFDLSGKYGFWGVETDLYATSDGIIVCMHDETIDRMTDGTGNVYSMTYTQLSQYHIDTGNNVGTYTQSELVIPTIDDYLSICSYYGMVAFIEIKTDIVSTVIQKLKDYGMEHRAVISSFSYDLLKKTREISDVFIHYILSDTSTTHIDDLSLLGNAGRSFNYTNLDSVPSDLRQNMARKNVKYCFRAVDTVDDIKKQVKLGVCYIPTNTIKPIQITV